MNIRMKTPPSETELLGLILDMVVRITGRPLPRDDTMASKGFIALGVDSVNVFQLQIEMEDQFKVALPETFLVENSTPRKAAAALRELSLQSRHSDE
jgi:acyl carrier protein